MNRLTRLTITGADDGVAPADLVAFARDAPFVEWGILVSETRMGSPRYPSRAWIGRLIDAIAFAFVDGKPVPKLSLHVCGRWVRELLLGNDGEPVQALATPAFDRVQLNGVAGAVFGDRFPALLPAGVEVIFQVGADGSTAALECARAAGVRCASLFDASGGKGVSPSLWPLPIPGVAPGWAGGLAPWNVAEVVRDLEALPPLDCEPVDFWVDMETGARTTDVFDWNKVRAAVEAVRPYVKPPTEKPQ